MAHNHLSHGPGRQEELHTYFSHILFLRLSQDECSLEELDFASKLGDDCYGLMMIQCSEIPARDSPIKIPDHLSAAELR